MTIESIKFTQPNMLCHKCLLNVLKSISQIEGIKEFDADVESKRVKESQNKI